MTTETSKVIEDFLRAEINQIDMGAIKDRTCAYTVTADAEGKLKVTPISLEEFYNYSCAAT